MKSEFFYLTLAAFVIIIFVVILLNIQINSETARIKPDEKEILPQEAMVEAPGIAIEQAPQSASVSVHNPAITVIRPPAEEKAVEVFEDKIEEIQKSTDSFSPAAQSSPVSQGAEENFSDEPASGITKMNKRPSEAESKEMNEQGIMIW